MKQMHFILVPALLAMLLVSCISSHEREHSRSPISEDELRRFWRENLTWRCSTSILATASQSHHVAFRAAQDCVIEQYGPFYEYRTVTGNYDPSREEREWLFGFEPTETYSGVLFIHVSDTSGKVTAYLAGD